MSDILFAMREELEEQSKWARETREESETLGKAERKKNDARHYEFRLATYSKLALDETQIAALEWFYKRPNILENWEIYSALPKAFPTAAKFLSVMKHAKPIAADTDWLQTKAFSGDDFDDFLEELPSLCRDHGVWENRFALEYELREKHKKKRSRFWWSVLVVVVLLILTIVNLN